MSDPLRDDPRTTGEGGQTVDHPAKIEELLLLGLDQYFLSHHEQAINIWTRVLFLDRGHARARAYIERARSALAERQREGDELLHAGVDAFQRGDVATARGLLTTAAERGISPEVALALLQRLDRLEPGQTLEPASVPSVSGERATRTIEPPLPVRRPRRRSRVGPIALTGLVTAGGLLALTSWESVDRLLFPGSAIPAGAPIPQRAAERVPVPAPGELSLEHARQLYDRGHLHECLAALDEIQIGDGLKPEADLLRAAVQRALLAGTPPLQTDSITPNLDRDVR
jgi:hypothetical protein